MAKARGEDGCDGDSMPIFAVDGLPCIDADWLERRIYRDSSRASRWRQEADRCYWRTDCEGRAIRAAYLTQSLQASHRVERWRRNLALTQAAIVGVQKDTRICFGLLVKERRTAAGCCRDIAPAEMKWRSMYRPFRGADRALWRWMVLLSKQNLLLTSSPADELLTSLEGH